MATFAHVVDAFRALFGFETTEYGHVADIDFVEVELETVGAAEGELGQSGDDHEVADTLDWGVGRRWDVALEDWRTSLQSRVAGPYLAASEVLVKGSNVLVALFERGSLATDVDCDSMR